MVDGPQSIVHRPSSNVETCVDASWLMTVLTVAIVSTQTAAGIQRAAWLQGCWQMSTPSRVVEEIWSAPNGGSMIGMSRTVRDTKLADYEFIVLQEHGDRLSYTAQPSGQTATMFLSVTIEESQIVFENLAHDFPQQIGYRLKGDTLLAWISGTQNGKARRIEFPYRRVSCAGP